jgi:lipopolysaccharide export system protein LptC
MTVTAAQNGVPSAHTYWTVNRGDGARAFRAARRHSRVVRVLRVAVPIFVVLLIALVVAVTYFNPANMFGKLPLNVGNLVVSGTKITMEQPHLTGFTRDARAYDLTAESAAQDITKPDIVELKGIRAKMDMQDKSTVNVTAATGVYDSKAEKLKLERDIVLTTSSGYQGRLSEAFVDIRSGNVVSEQPVELNLLQGTLNAKRLEVTESGTVIRFGNGVRLMLMPENDASAPAAEPGASKP